MIHTERQAEGDVRPARDAWSYEAGADATRELFLLSLSSPELFPDSKEIESRHFACLVVWDSRIAPSPQVDDLLTKLLRQGASYLMFWGPGCERLHDFADEIISHPDADFGLAPDVTVMTTDHAGESLDDAVRFFLDLSSPDPSLADTTRAGLVVTVACSDWATQVDRALADPSALRGRAIADDPEA